MKKTFILVLMAVMVLAGCKQKTEAPAEPEFVTDEYGVVRCVNPSEKAVYLVFTAHYSTNDDGYFENFDGIVPVLDILKEKDVKGSFFPTGNCFRVEKYQEPIRRIIDEGHYLSAHSNHHLLLCTEDEKRETLVPADSLAKDIAGMEEELMKFGLEKEQFCWMIPPYEYYNQETADGLRALGYKLCNHTEGIHTSSDWMGPEASNYVSAEEQVQNIWDYEKASETGLNGCIILVHAMVYPDRTDEDRVYSHLGEIIDGLAERGYSFKTFKDLL
ncbi:MAG: polysaccharide deacetylase family protein [Bacteroidales bacterium]|nr:polysaccharide deacetylase family protein [Candidatus Cacconaster merdequi]